ncbi:MAG: GAF domain-containing protein [Spirochaetaceae bacterium]|nr:MAG: GAF domain-containing protein [Spirochaetaceae bacterium]
MLTEQLIQVVASPMTGKFVVLGFLTLNFVLAGWGRSRDGLLLALPVLGILLARDVLFAFFPHAAIIAGSDLLVFLLYWRWFVGHSGDSKAGAVVSVLLACSLVLIAVFSVVNAQLSFVSVGVYRFFAVLVLVHYVILAVRMFVVPLKGDVGLVLKVRPVLAIGAVLTQLPLLFAGYGADITHVIILPLAYVVHGIVFTRLGSGGQSRRKTAVVDTGSAHLAAIVEFLTGIGQAVVGTTNLEAILQNTVLSAGKLVGADGCAILLMEEDDQERMVLTPKAIYGVYSPPMPMENVDKADTSDIRTTFEMSRIPVPQTALGECADSRQAVFIADAAGDERMQYNQDDDAMYVSSFMALPLVFEDKVYGVISLVRRSRGDFFSDADFTQMQQFSKYISITMSNLFSFFNQLQSGKVDHEVSIAADIQKHLLPRKLPQLPQIASAAYSAASRGVSGDYYDVLPLNRGKKLAVMMCDVAGKGIPAAMVMAIIRTILHLIAGAEQQTSRVLRWINRGIASQVGIEHYATMSYLTYEIETRELVYSNAAHHPMMVYRAAEKTVESCDTPGLPIGLDKFSEYGEQRLDLAEGDILCLYTDGISEAMNDSGEQFGVDRMNELLIKHAEEDADAIVKLVVDAVNEFAGDTPQHDDQTIMVLKVLQ